MLKPSQIQKILKTAEEFFGTADDPEQIPISNSSFQKLMSLDQETIKLKTGSEENPLSWTVVIPTSKEVMNLFLEKKITERMLFDEAVAEKKFEALYLCSAFTIPRHRQKGLATDLFLDSIKKFAPDKSIKLYAWIYSEEGRKLINKLQSQLGRKIRIRNL